MVTSSKVRMAQCSDDDHQEDAPRFNFCGIGQPEYENTSHLRISENFEVNEFENNFLVKQAHHNGKMNIK